MKKTIAMVLVAALAAAVLSAQGFGPGMMGQGPNAASGTAAQITKIEGKLALINGHPGIAVKDKTYYVGIPQFMYGFVDGLKEGAQVRLEGYEYSLPYAPNFSMLHATKLTFNGKEYDLTQAAGMGRGRGMPDNDRGGRNGGRGGMSGGMGARW